MSRHHDELAIQFELLIGTQKELKESFENVQSNWQNKKELSSLIEIDQWEQEIISRIREHATKARTTVNEIMTKYMSDIRRHLDQLAFDMEQRQQEGNYLDNDITEIQKQLEQLNNNIKHVHEKIRINQTATNKVDWNSLIYVVTDKRSSTKRFSFTDFHHKEEQEEEEEEFQDKLWNNFRKLLRNKHSSVEFRNRESSFKRNATSVSEPIVLDSFESSTCSYTRQNSYCPSKSTIFENFPINSNDESFIHKNFVAIDHDHLLPQASDA